VEELDHAAGRFHWVDALMMRDFQLLEEFLGRFGHITIGAIRHPSAPSGQRGVGMGQERTTRYPFTAGMS
jgi:hypothetical protein